MLVLSSVQKILRSPYKGRSISRQSSWLLKDADFLFSPASKTQKGGEISSKSENPRDEANKWVPKKDPSFQNHVRLPVPGLHTDYPFHTMWLRLNCKCPKCCEPSSGQRTFAPWIPKSDVKFKKTNVSEPEYSSDCFEVETCGFDKDDNSFMQIEFTDKRNGEIHAGKVAKETLVNLYNHNAFKAQINDKRTPKALAGPIKEVQYSEFYSSEQGLMMTLDELLYSGVVILKNAPQNPETIQMCMGKFGPIQETIYGIDFSVKVESDPINIAYSGEYLDYHMDLIYYESAPGLQGLHAYQFDTQTVGGDSFLLDVFAVAEQLKNDYPELFKTLHTVPATFQKIHFERQNPVYLRSHKPHIEVNREGNVIAVNWAPPFEGPMLLAEPSEMCNYYEAYTKFGQMIQDSKLRKLFKLEENDLVIFNNRRIMHGRSEILEGSGSRHLMGAYVNIDEFYKTYNTLAVKMGKPVYPVRVGNRDHL